MGAYQETISNHNIDFSSAEAMLKDLAERFQCNIQLKYYSNELFSQLLNEPYDENDNLIMNYVLDFNLPCMVVYDQIYKIRQLYEKIEDDFFFIEELRSYDGSFHYMYTSYSYIYTDVITLKEELQNDEGYIGFKKLLEVGSYSIQLESEKYIDFSKHLIHYFGYGYGKYSSFIDVIRDGEPFDDDYYDVMGHLRPLRTLAQFFGASLMGHYKDHAGLGDIVYPEYMTFDDILGCAETKKILGNKMDWADLVIDIL